NVMVALVLVACGAAYGYVQFQFDQIRRLHILGLNPEGSSDQSKAQGSSIAPFTLLAVGSDTRNIPGGSQFQGTGANATTGQRSDSIILIRVNPQAKAVGLLSIPRDTIVPIPGVGTTRINEAFNSGNANLLVQVLHNDFGIEVNHYAEANFDTFEQLANAVGGVNVWFPAPARDSYSLFRVGPATDGWSGCANLTGSLALGFVRSRHYEYYLNGSWHSQLLPESDLARIQRQQTFIKLALQKARHIAPTNVTELDSLISSVTQNLTLDSTFSNSELLSLAETFRSANLSTIPQYTYPTVNSVKVSGALDPDTSAGPAVVQQWLDVGQPAGSSTGTTTPTSAPTTTAVSPSSVAIEVANGSGIAGQAAKAAADLSGLGYITSVTQTSYRPRQSSTLVLYAPTEKAAAEQVQGQLQGGATLQSDSALASTQYPVEVVTGTSYAGVTGGHSTGSTTSTTRPSTTPTTLNEAITGAPKVEADSSSYANGQYIPPGRTPTQTVGSCQN
ncbi:MAG TPA: LCP family protein, partial [Acidimicrobiales bacterium]|nr:LCP family protein [Acidimicrobiales bacterium]